MPPRNADRQRITTKFATKSGARRGLGEEGAGRRREFLAAEKDNLEWTQALIDPEHLRNFHQDPGLDGVGAIFGKNHVVREVDTHMQRVLARTNKQEQVSKRTVV